MISEDPSKMATDTVALDPALAVLLKVLSTLYTIGSIIVWWIIGMVKALLPSNVLPQKSFKGEHVLITGSGSGLGRQLALCFARRGAKLILWDISAAGNEETKRLVEAEGAKAHCYTVDISEREAIYECARRVLNEHDHRIDVLVNNAGIVSGKTFFESSDEQMEKTMRVNTFALFWLAKAFLPQMISRDHGHIVTVASMAGKIGIKGLVDYCASKFGAVGFSEAMYAELRHRSKNLHLTMICPYYINTGMFDGVKSSSPITLPILEPEYVAERALEAVATNMSCVCLPRFTYTAILLKELMPTVAGVRIADFIGVNREIEGFYNKKRPRESIKG